MDVIIKNILRAFSGKKYLTNIKNLNGFFGVIIDIANEHVEHWDRNGHEKIVFKDLLNEIKQTSEKLAPGCIINFMWMKNSVKLVNFDNLIDNRDTGILIESIDVSENPNNFNYKFTNILPGTYKQKIDAKKIKLKYKNPDIYLYKIDKFTHKITQSDLNYVRM
jgi:hypothetical protein